MYTLDIVIVIR